MVLRACYTVALAICGSWPAVVLAQTNIGAASGTASDTQPRLLTDVAISTPDGATVCAVIALPRTGPSRFPALLTFTIYADSVAAGREALLNASKGYAGVVATARGKACSPDAITPFRNDGADADAVIEWIARQRWSDGRVGMYGGSYSGYTTWAATKRVPRALKAIMTGAPVAPGIDSPMEGNVFLNFLYPWHFFVNTSRWLDTRTYRDFARWNRLNEAWYASGRPYRELEKIDGAPNPLFADWLAHPSFDDRWKSIVPTDAEFARIDIPVLQTAGYFFGGPGGALWYFREHTRNNPAAQHYLVFGPWDHPQAQRGVVSASGDTSTTIAGYEIDRVARLDLVQDLRYPWFDHVLKGAPLPALLRDRIAFELPGANEWKHAPSLEAMSPARLRLYLNANRHNGRHSLTRAPGATGSEIVQTVDLRDRTVSPPVVGGILDRAIDTANAIVLVGEPLAHDVDVAGPLSGHLELIVNKRDFDFVVTPYELRADGLYFQLAPFTQRASHVASPTTRTLLESGAVQRLDFGNGIRLLARRMRAGSRIVVTIAVPKTARQQINYGTGRDVSDESIADAEVPLVIRWLPGSYIELPVIRACCAH